MYWEKDVETMDRADLAGLQLQRLNASLTQAKRSAFYGKRFSSTSYNDEILELRDLSRIPFTTKDDLRNAFPYGFLSVDLQEVIRLHSSSGTTGNPTVVFHTASDIDRWGNLIARCMYTTGVRKHDVFQNMMGYGLFTGGLGFHYGAEKLGVMTIPIGPGNSKRQIWFLKQLKATVIHILPSYALRLYSFFEELEVDPKRDLHLRIAFIGAEPHSEEIRKKIELLYGIKVYNSYGLSEMCGPGVAFECECQDGLHVWEDHFYPEIIDPDTGEVLPDGERGELVLTTLSREAMPLVRYRTRDLTRFLPGKCPCGRTHRRIDRITGRSDDMLIINGVNIFPIQIEKTLMAIPEIGRNYLIEIHKESFMDKLSVKVEINEEVFQGTLAELEKLQGKAVAALRTELGVTPSVKLVEPSSLPVSEGKAQRVYDYRDGEKGSL
ncbi:MAG: phenylacetate--CoA ligase [Spirochaetaceae bacterium]|nr:MAG: phenylacetate--CoA ligase [Spirochaetaceae bacterium]